ncbi:site-specific integrase [Tepidicaulis sp.]|uniref:site-specific integrase n=1 Tax=Tepidicaulis sp. TaxID=1920809 RepID=UPI003B5B2A28
MNAPSKFHPTKLQVRLALESIFNTILREGEEERDKYPYGQSRFDPHPDDYKPDIEDPSSDSYSEEETEALRRYDDRKSSDPGIWESVWATLAEKNYHERAFQFLSPELAKQGIKVDEEDPVFIRIARDATRVIASAYKINYERWQGVYNSKQALPSFIDQKYPLNMPLVRAWTSDLRRDEADFLSKTIEEVCADFSKLRQKNGAGPKTLRDDEMARRYFTDLIGNPLMQDLTPEMAEQFPAALLRVPRYYGRGIYAKLAPSEAIKRADELEKIVEESGPIAWPIAFHGRVLTEKEAKERCERMRRKTANKHLTFFTSLWRSSLVPRSLRTMNPFEGTLYRKSAINDETAKRGTREPFTQSDLDALFSSPVWSGCRSERFRSQPGTVVLKDWKYWCPLIAYYTGMRREEVARLRSDDFDILEGIWFLTIRPSHDRRLKTKASIRDVPVHSGLIALGLQELVESRSTPGPLFPELRATGAYKEHGEQLGKWFREYRRKCGLYDPHKDFHSFRHTFIKRLRDSGAPTDLIGLIVGHEDGSITGSVYGKQVSMTQRKAIVELLPDLNLRAIQATTV